MLIMVLASGGPAWPLQGTEKDDAAIARQREVSLKEMKQRLGRITVRVRQKDDEVELKSPEQPLLRFNDPAREFHDGAVWAFGERGRPAVLLALERYGSKWNWELVSTSKEGLSAELVDGWKWAPARPGLELRELPDAEAPAESEAGRLRQMKSFARRFTAEETAGGQRYELRVLPQPLVRYADPDGGIVDGAMFAYVYGTNPEVIAVLECHKTDGGHSAWWYGFVPLTTAGASAGLDGTTVWSKSHTPLPRRQDPYTFLGDPAVKDGAP
jgi:hypothetical protein